MCCKQGVLSFIKLGLFGLLLCCVDVFAATWLITYPKPSSESDRSSDYPLKVLTLALEQTGVKYELVPSRKFYTQGKNLIRLKDNREINVVWSMTDKQREQDLLPIRIPLYKGLIGWRLFLIREDMAERFKYIQKLEHLQKLSPIQGSDWPDTKILQSNNFNVITNRDHEELARMLSNAQGDFFPRSMLEIWDEVASFRSSNKVIIQPSLGFYYPTAFYFFVNSKSTPLAHLITTGLEKAIKNGEFEALFLETYHDYIEKSNIQKRKMYLLENTFLPAETPLDRKELWFDAHAD
ncbi:amino acid ABC transporter substrate-binding protein [Paraglaciecola aquimarina]|uniref:Amino acid ABC transporter substrate-binding protein n=1 Tax=Paraglaciecola aquimarina TaxID=1235557 RepID=A0ABU3T043_9ALTE|nr:amino acid ABC transporter substrate-binding protein [Paraglaciecola aquimarina]MDU0355635.1 amino acid ABC transporter substrate-binding protein [Paraglaciecola aquimarina]